MDSNRGVKVSRISQNGLKTLHVYQYPWVQLSLSQKSRVQFELLHPSNGGPEVPWEIQREQWVFHVRDAVTYPENVENSYIFLYYRTNYHSLSKIVLRSKTILSIQWIKSY